MFDFDVVTGPNAAEILRDRAGSAANADKAAGLAPGPAAPLSSEPKDSRDRGE